MPRLTDIRRINTEDFPEEDRQTVEQLGYILNYFMEDVVNVVNGNIDFENLARDIITLEISVNSTGTPLKNARFSSDLSIVGTKVIRATNLTNSALFVPEQPFISYTNSGTGIYTINNITGLTSGQTYRLTIELIGQ